ncbi:FHA domain-containing protein [Cesiribacter sp. SM1]|uniref:FHA domain-containing protein n=1 Tax=Cesiribacter sp. SM1 TaxID=2861196 RepID=UPI001CD7B7A5|nr:FHA domain-containing protein [Cesiribacter sp. SM1]
MPGAADADSRSKKTVVIGGKDEAPWDQVNAAPAQRSRQQGGVHTVRRIVPDPNTCCLVAISLDEEKELRKIDLQEDPVQLDRNLLDPGNSSISRSGHATIYEKNGKWYVENLTALKTTFIQVNGPVELTDGDVLLMGDSLFKFKMGKKD